VDLPPRDQNRIFDVWHPIENLQRHCKTKLISFKNSGCLTPWQENTNKIRYMLNLKVFKQKKRERKHHRNWKLINLYPFTIKIDRIRLRFQCKHQKRTRSINRLEINVAYPFVQVFGRCGWFIKQGGFNKS
jgi:hypothetical protein